KVEKRLDERRLGLDRREIMDLRLGNAAKVAEHVAEVEPDNRVAGARTQAGMVEVLCPRQIAGAGCLFRSLKERVRIGRSLLPAKAHLAIEFCQDLADAQHQVAGWPDVQ